VLARLERVSRLPEARWRSRRPKAGSVHWTISATGSSPKPL